MAETTEEIYERVYHTEHFAQLREKAHNLPLRPGVYIMQDAQSQVIYVGKAKALKNRVSQYFAHLASHTEKTKAMVSSIHHFDVIVADSEFEALVLECALIKRHQPKYNILLKDAKGYPYIRLTVKEDYPKFDLSNKAAEDGARYFGPYGSRGASNAIIDSLLETFKLPTCHKKFPRDIGKERPCLNFHMGKCDGYCRRDMDQSKYQEGIDQAVRLLEGKKSEVIADLTCQMEQCAENLQFERAAALRDRIRAVELLAQRQKVVGRLADTDVVGFYRGEAKSCFVVLHFAEGELAAKDMDLIETPMEGEESQVISALIAQYYSPRSDLPGHILLPCEVEDEVPLARMFSEQAGRKVELVTPQRGAKLDLIRMAHSNAVEEVERATSHEERRSKTLEALGKVLNLPETPNRIESYDISNTGRDNIVASMVVFEGAKPKRRDYRTFKIKDVTSHPDDYHSMEEVLTRRFRRYLDGDADFGALPDLLLIDGGQEHAKIAEGVLARCGLKIPTVGMVKDDRHRTRALIDAWGNETGIQQIPALFALVGQIQEETHRFAITFHRSQKSKSMRASQLDNIPGIGESRRKALLKRFKTIKAIRSATVDELKEVLPQNAAQAVYDHFKGTKEN